MFDFNININEALSPSKAIQFAKLQGLRAFALFYSTDYIFDFKSIDLNSLNQEKKQEVINSNSHLKQLLDLKNQIHTLSIYYDVQAFFGIKLSYLPPALLEETISTYRYFGFNIIGVHVESITENVELGTNFFACSFGADILFNPGLIDEQTVELAAKNNTFLEISSHQNHAYCNAHIMQLAKKFQAKTIIGSNASILSEIHTLEMQKLICAGACININDLNNQEFFQKNNQIKFI